MPRIVRLYLVSACVGFLAAAVFVALILYFNVVNLQHLIFTSDIGSIAMAAFWILNGIVFTGVQFAYSITRLASSSE